MFIMCEETNTLINLDKISCIFIWSDYVTLKAIDINGNSYKLGQYRCQADARKALQDINRQLKNPSSNIIELMTDDDVKAELSR